MPITAAAASRVRAPSRGAHPWLLAGARAAALIPIAALVTFPALIPGGPAGLRTTELVGLAANAALALALLSQSALHRAAVPIAVAACLSIPWVWAEVVSVATLTTDNPARFALVRWVMGLATGYWLAVLMDDGRCRRVVGVGLILGLLLSLATILYDAATFDPSFLATLSPEELDDYAHIWGAGGEYRAGGILGHANGAAAVVLLLVPLVIGLVEERRLPAATILLVPLAIGAVYVATQTRGPTTIATALLFWHLYRGSAMRKVTMVTALALALGAAAVGGILPMVSENDPLLDRFVNQASAAENADGRLLTTFTSLELALLNPLGLGSSYIGALSAAIGWGATHNAYVQLALMGGLPITLFVVARLLANAVLPATPGRVTESWVATYVAGAFMFENLFFAPTFTLFTVWLLWRPSSRRT